MADEIASARSAAIRVMCDANRIVRWYREDKHWHYPPVEEDYAGDEPFPWFSAGMPRILDLPVATLSEFLHSVIAAERAVYSIGQRIMQGVDRPVRCGTIVAETAHHVAIRFGRCVGGAIVNSLCHVTDSGKLEIQDWPKDSEQIDSRLLEKKWESVRQSLAEIEPLETDELEAAIKIEAAHILGDKEDGSQLRDFGDSTGTQVDTTPKGPTSTVDGPFRPDGFCWKGERHNGMQAIPWKLVNELWAAKDQTVFLDSLAKPVWDLDHICDVNEHGFDSARKKANGFFADNKIPLKVAKKRRSDPPQIILEQL